MDCIYPQPNRRQRATAGFGILSEELLTITGNNDAEVLWNALDLGDWGEIGDIALNGISSEATVPYDPTLVSPHPGAQSVQWDIIESGDLTNAISRPWFLQDETWALEHCAQEAVCVTFAELEPFIRTVEEMLQNWVKNGYNSFIHQRLYEIGMPTCLQDAFTTLAAYTSRTPAVKEMILQIAEERSFGLVKQNPPGTQEIQGIVDHLARVQALFIYMFIRLFDGSVRRRASAEPQIPILRRWMVQMLEAVKQYHEEDKCLRHHSLPWASEFDKEYNKSSRMWRLWILTESVRRSHLVFDFIANIYETMTKGWAECAGGVMFTARKGLWEAENPMKWFELSSAKSPLLVPSLNPGPFISLYAADEFDDFAKTYWAFLIGTDKIQCWIDKSDKMKETNPFQ